MTAPKIDVLAVMDRAAECAHDEAADICNNDDVAADLRDTASRLIEARAAVAELIEASVEFHEAVGAARSALPGMITITIERASKADKNLRAAIARIGGAA